MSNKRKSIDELRDLSDAIDDSILGASDVEVIEELGSLGIDLEKLAAEMDAIAEDAKRNAAKSRLAQAKDAVNALRNNRPSISQLDKTVLRSKLHRIQSASPSENDRFTMAARKGNRPAPNDEEGLLDDLAQLQALDAAEDPESSGE